MTNENIKVYVIQKLVFNEASGELYSNGTVVLGNKEKAFNKFKEYVEFYEKQSEYYEKITNLEKAVIFHGGGDVELVEIRISELEPIDGMVDFSI